MNMARRPSPFGELLSLRQAMDRLFEDSYVRSRGVPYGSVEALALPLDIYSTPDALVVEAALPGVKPDDVEITVFGNTLTISGTSFEDRATQEPDFMYQELRRGTFARTVALPSNLDTPNSTATFEHGMLSLTIPKAPEAKPRQIRITQTHDMPAGQSAGNESWAAGTAAGQGAGAQSSAEPAWEPAAGTDAWTDPSTAHTDSWAQSEGTAEPAWDPATAGSGDWNQPGTSAEWSDPTATADQAQGSGETWGQGAAGTDDRWSGSAGDTWGQPAAEGSETWGTETQAADGAEWQAGDEQGAAWQPTAAGQWEEPTAQSGDGASPEEAAPEEPAAEEPAPAPAPTPTKRQRGGREQARG